MLTSRSHCARDGDSPRRPATARERSRQARRANERLVALQREADALANQQRSLLVDLRRLEVERDLKTEQLRQIEADTQKVALELGNTGNQIDALEERNRGVTARSSKRAWSSSTSWAAPDTCACSSMHRL